jgi:hypothetical protein
LDFGTLERGSVAAKVRSITKSTCEPSHRELPFLADTVYTVRKIRRQNPSHRCPFCKTVFWRPLPTRTVKVWRNLAKDDYFNVGMATCQKCGADFEVWSEGGIRNFRGSPFLLVLALVTLLASLLDGLLSLQLVERGAQEINPLLAGFLHESPLHFMLAKHFLTCLGIVFLVLYNERRLFGRQVRVRHLLLAAQLLFAGIIVYEGALLAGVDLSSLL